ncbi:MAG: hypothetical protein L6264_11405 [Weeksellaceae bacterium]|nr:hypothetical protein [Bacteroidota bacterium]MCG2781544.1 hypothetical protein [Weeksellaceae bacterium]
MSTAELKIDLINQIVGITDKVRLKELLQLLRFQSDESVYTTTPEEKLAVAEAREEIEKGKVLSNEDVQNEIKKWLEK